MKEQKRYAKPPLFSKIFFPAILLAKKRARMEIVYILARLDVIFAS